jgi:hypothetical protein
MDYRLLENIIATREMAEKVDDKRVINLCDEIIRLRSVIELFRGDLLRVVERMETIRK